MTADMFGAPRASEYSKAQKLAEIEREIAMRKRVYARWVAAGKLDSVTADYRIRVMQAIRNDYKPPAPAGAQPRRNDGDQEEAQPKQGR